MKEKVISPNINVYSLEFTWKFNDNQRSKFLVSCCSIILNIWLLPHGTRRLLESSNHLYSSQRKGEIARGHAYFFFKDTAWELPKPLTRMLVSHWLEFNHMATPRNMVFIPDNHLNI